jgi:hypothetical protein
MFNLLTGAYGSLIKLGLIVVLLGGLYGGYRYQLHNAYANGVTVTQTHHEAERLAQNEVLQLKKRSVENDLKRTLESQRNKHDSQIKTLGSTASNFLNSLPSNPNNASTSNSTGDSSTTTVVGTANGAELSFENARLLVQEAVRADEIRLSLLQCYKDYDTVKQAVESFKN